MRAAILRGPRTMACEDVPIPEPGAGEVLVRVAYCGVCGSDVPRYLDGAVHSFPLVLGHEFSGKVVRVGEGVDANFEGARVAGIPLVPCMACADCQAGNYSLCKQYSFIGSRQHGAYAEYVVLPASNVVSISDSVSDFDAAFFEPATVALHAIDLMAPEAESSAVVVGCGTIGILLAQALRALGVETWGLGRRMVRLAAAKAGGVAHVADTSQDGWRENLLANLPRAGFDYVFDTSGNAALMTDSFSLAANKGGVCMVGTPKRPIEFSVSQWELLNRRELTVRGSWMSYSAPWPGTEWARVEKLFGAGAMRVVPEMIDAVYPLEEIAQGMERFAIPGDVSGKMIVDCR